MKQTFNSFAKVAAHLHAEQVATIAAMRASERAPLKPGTGPRVLIDPYAQTTGGYATIAVEREQCEMRGDDCEVFTRCTTVNGVVACPTCAGE